MQIFNFDKYDVKGIEGHKRSSPFPGFQKNFQNTFIYDFDKNLYEC